MARQKRLLLDLDEVVADFIGFYLTQASTKMDRKYTKEQVTTWDISKSLDLPPWAKSEIEFELSRPGAAHKICLLPGAQDAVHELAKHCEIVFVTAPYKGSKTWANDRVEWVYNKFGMVGTKVISTNYKTPIDGDVFVDDKPENLQPWIEEHTGKAVLWDHPHNRNYKHPLIKRMSEWSELISLVKSL
jgi:5'(3')-deoxyribonucleotidase